MGHDPHGMFETPALLLPWLCSHPTCKQELLVESSIYHGKTHTGKIKIYILIPLIGNTNKNMLPGDWVACYINTEL